MLQKQNKGHRKATSSVYHVNMMTGDVAFWTYVSDVLWLDK